MGALTAVLLGSKGRQQRHALPLTIASDKSGIGHTEPAAGMSGLVHAVAAAAGYTALPVLHLRALNPYLIGTLEAPGVAGGVSIPRQQRGAMLGQHPAGSITGVSSFAFQVRSYGGCRRLWQLASGVLSAPVPALPAAVVG